MKTATRTAGHRSIRTANPFVWLAAEPPAVALSAAALACVPCLDGFAQDSAPWLVAALVGFTYDLGHERVRTSAAATVTSVLNRRRRAATMWVQAILAGKADPATLRQLTTVWLPQLVGCGPELWRGARAGRDAIEYLRGAFTARIVVEPQGNLVPEARALHALEAVLGAHLFAWQTAVEQAIEAQIA